MRNNKQSRKSQVVAEDLLRIAPKMWKRHEYKGRDSTTEETQFITFFGCPVGVSITLWALLDGHEYIPDGGRLEHMLWSLMFLKTYSKSAVLCSLARGVDKDTYMNWVWQFLESIVLLQEFVVSKTHTILLSIPFSLPVFRLFGKTGSKMILIMTVWLPKTVQILGSQTTDQSFHRTSTT